MASIGSGGGGIRYARRKNSIRFVQEASMEPPNSNQIQIPANSKQLLSAKIDLQVAQNFSRQTPRAPQQTVFEDFLRQTAAADRSSLFNQPLSVESDGGGRNFFENQHQQQQFFNLKQFVQIDRENQFQQFVLAAAAMAAYAAAASASSNSNSAAAAAIFNSNFQNHKLQCRLMSCYQLLPDLRVIKHVCHRCYFYENINHLQQPQDGIPAEIAGNGDSCYRSIIIGEYIYFPSEDKWIFVNLVSVEEEFEEKQKQKQQQLRARFVPPYHYQQNIEIRNSKSVAPKVRYCAHRSHTPSTNFADVIHREPVRDQWPILIGKLLSLQYSRNGRSSQQQQQQEDSNSMMTAAPSSSGGCTYSTKKADQHFFQNKSMNNSSVLVGQQQQQQFDTFMGPPPNRRRRRCPPPAGGADRSAPGGDGLRLQESYSSNDVESMEGIISGNEGKNLKISG